MHIILAGGCFWGVQHYFNQLNGILATTAGYIGGALDNPTYQDVCSKSTGHIESVKIDFDDAEITFTDIIDIFFKIHDPTTLNKQGTDVGSQYASAIFYQNESQKKLILAKIDEYQPYFKNKIVTAVLPETQFYPAEEYHQDYILKNNTKCHLNTSAFDEKAYYKDKLSPNLYNIAREKGTESPFIGAYNNFHKKGIYHCAVCNQKLFSSNHKFDCTCGWPSFDKSIPNAITFKKDFSSFMIRSECLCARCQSHLGHIFNDGPTETGKRYCINSISLKFEEE